MIQRLSHNGARDGDLVGDDAELLSRYFFLTTASSSRPLRLWRLRAVAYSDPGYAGRLAAARAGRTAGDVPAEQVIAGWPRR